jgi:hypothetical protein
MDCSIGANCAITTQDESTSKQIQTRSSNTSFVRITTSHWSNSGRCLLSKTVVAPFAKSTTMTSLDQFMLITIEGVVLEANLVETVCGACCVTTATPLSGFYKTMKM